ncbi:CAMK family protein kinase [Trichomonas vaginalis G3]|uniref:CAMK family protein kinase n=1 Tax=Trichomonas vaginalis (strain ATCC PRA-98 / G3) TaxID=412133 RepID=A2FAQ0_TRIV3|nr:protein serine/threonine kinase protein [Trichomonas vaginalis G3]EAX98036.1 CAMK family protein kinase [Trichomonas vaginalis G3]KAI5528577.1 protein serine/threonine kinase protein [Trichomonas vaginalis G3]|eukprot:XP_001310966.1 CAMK family protein kinase [Trichomonas vaginalis G3]
MLNGTMYKDYIPYSHVATTANSQVFLATKVNDSSFKTYIMKIVQRTHRNPKAISNLEGEIRIMQKIDHPSIIKLLDVIYDQDEVTLVIEYGENGDLVKYLNEKGVIDLNTTLSIMRDIFDAIAYLHARNIAHRDIKLENIVITAEGKPKLIDLGLSKEYINNENPNNEPLQERSGKILKTTFCGTYEYMAPELFEKHVFYDPFAADVWAAGMCLYVLYNGFFPWVDSEFGALDQIRRTKISIPKTWPAIIRRVVSMSLEIDPCKRAKAKDILNEMDNFMNNKEIPMPKLFSNEVCKSSPAVLQQKSKASPIRKRKIIVPNILKMMPPKYSDSKGNDSILCIMK